MPRQRYVNPMPAPDEPQDFVRRLLELVEDSSARFPSKEFYFATNGLKAMLETPGLSWDEALPLGPRRGERWYNEGPAKRALIRKVGDGVEGEPMQRALQIAAMLRGEASPRSAAAAAALEQLRRLPSFGKSERTVLRALTEISELVTADRSTSALPACKTKPPLNRSQSPFAPKATSWCSLPAPRRRNSARG